MCKGKSLISYICIKLDYSHLHDQCGLGCSVFFLANLMETYGRNAN